jgi:hypothetical protein
MVQTKEQENMTLSPFTVHHQYKPKATNQPANQPDAAGLYMNTSSLTRKEKPKTEWTGYRPIADGKEKEKRNPKPSLC